MMPTRTSSPPWQTRTTQLLAALAVAQVQVLMATSDGHAAGALAIWCVAVGTTAGLAWLARRWDVGHSGPPVALAGALGLAAFGAPWAVAALDWGRGRDAVPLELMGLAALRNLLVVLAAGGAWPRLRDWAALVSVFLTLFCFAMQPSPAVVVLVVVYVVAGAVWLLLSYWSRVTAHLPATSSRRLPWRGWSFAAALLGAVVVGSSVAPLAPLGNLPGWLLSSGGSLSASGRARSGVNDGSASTDTARNPQSVGFANSNVYLDSPLRSLYDAFNETYGEPQKPTGRVERAIALSQQPLKSDRGHPPQDLRTGREFSTVRQSPPSSSRASAHAANSLVFVEGRVPLHLRVETYDRYDGRVWHAAEPTETPLWSTTGHGTWMGRGQAVAAAWLSGTERHTLKVGQLAGPRVPTPEHLDGFRMGEVHLPEFFRWLHGGVLAMRFQKHVPPGTVVDMTTRVVNSRKLTAHSAIVPVALPSHPAIPSAVLLTHDPEVRSLVDHWTADAAPGWPQVEALIAGLRSHAEHDPAATVPADVSHPVRHFLLESRRGPDYLFATAAALLLPGLGYEARVASGFYAAPERYDASSGQVPVRAGDVHFWVELRARDGSWIVLEPTPGYSLRSPPVNYGPALAESLRAAVSWAREHSVLLTFVLVASAAGWRWWRAVADAVLTVGWWLSGLWQSADRRVAATLRLIERRAHWCGQARSPSTTLRHWAQQLLDASPTVADRSLDGLVTWHDRQTFRPSRLATSPSTPQREQLVEACRRVVRYWTRRRLSRLTPVAKRPGTRPRVAPRFDSATIDLTEGAA